MNRRIRFYWDQLTHKVEPDIAEAHGIKDGDTVSWEVTEAALTSQLQKTAGELDAIVLAKRQQKGA